MMGYDPKLPDGFGHDVFGEWAEQVKPASSESERHCSFCGERESETLVLFVQAKAAICGSCVTEFVGTMLARDSVMRNMLGENQMQRITHHLDDGAALKEQG